jgi:hypothetical protein
MASWSAQIQHRSVLTGPLREEETIEDGKQKHPDDKPIELADPKRYERPKAA